MEGVINRVARLARLGHFCCLGLVILAIFTINPVSISGDEANATTGTATSANTSLSLTTNHDNAVVTITPNSASGTFAMSSAAGEAQFGVTTNNFTGYELSIVANDDSGNLVNIDGNVEHSLFSIEAPISKSSFDTTAYNGKWGYKPSKYVSNNTVVTNTGDSALFLPSPTTSGTVLDHTTVANSSANNYSIALGVRADYNTYAGSYTKNFTLAAIANPTTYIIDYNKNTSDTVTNMPAAQSSATSATSITLASNTPERDRYNFLGWCTVQTADNTCSGTTYQPGDTYEIDQTAANTTTLYAMWGRNMSIQDVTSMQHFGSLSSADRRSVLSSMTTGQAYELVDTRDNEVYNIAKLADGRVWLLDNLRLDLVNVSLADLQGKTNASDTSLNYLKNGGRSAGDNYPTSGVAEWNYEWYYTYYYDYSYSDPLIATSGDCYNSDYCANDPASGQWAKDSLISYGSGLNKVGIYYNSCAASAGSYCYGDGTSRGTPSGNATEDICPVGWHIPVGGSSGEEYGLLSAAYGNNVDFYNAFHATPSGSYRYDSYYGMLAAFSQTRDRYFRDISSTSNNGQVVRCALTNPIAYSVSYNPNTVDTVSKMPSMQTGNTEISATISSNRPTRATGGFLGWCDTQPTASNGVDSCSGTTYQPGDSISYAQLSNNSNITLYAMWVTTTPLQNITPATCPTVPTYTYDARDSEVYTIQKLADDKCWLLDNLRLNLTDTAVQNNLSSSTTNASDLSLNYLKNGGGTTTDKYATEGVDDWATSVSSTTTPRIVTEAFCTSNYCTTTPIMTKDTVKTVSYSGNIVTGKVGIYYNYCAASAGSYCYNSSPDTSDATEDICPAGWRMPKTDEYNSLLSSYNNKANDVKTAFRVVNVGYASNYNSSSYNLAIYLGSNSSDAYSWSSRYYSQSSMYNMYLSKGDSYGSIYGATSTSSRYLGLPVRCIAQKLSGYSVSYDKNTTDDVTNMPSAQNGSAEFDVALSNNIPRRVNGGFLGWCDVRPVTSNGIDSCSGNAYKPGDSFTINHDQPGDNTKTLYAMWTTLTMQNTALSDCPTTPTLAYDSRDGEVYTIQRLADDKCWLLDNLRLDLTDTIVQNNLNSSTTNASDFSLNYLKNGGGTTSDEYATSGVQEWANSSFASSGSYSDPLIATSGTCYNSSSSYCVNDPSAGQWTKDSLKSYGSGQNKIGAYYNYCAASAGSYCYGNGASSSASSGDATEDICPAGWRMAVGGEEGEYQTLYTANGSYYDAFKNAFHFSASGYIYNGTAQGQGTYGSGNIWASTYTNGAMSVISINYDNRQVYPQSYADRNSGRSVRCVLDPTTTVSIYYDKNTSSPTSNMPTSQTGKLNSVNKIKLSDAVPDRTGYAFMGWCNTHPSTLNGIDLCYGDTFQPAGGYADASTGSATLYAIWALRSSIPAIQSVTSETCPAVPFPVYDIRDNEIYTIQKLADGRCWLLDNLRLDLSSTRTLTAANTNISSNWTAPTDVSSFANTYTEAKIYTESKDIRRQGNKIGIYYNYCAASAGTYCSGSNNNGLNATSDICPKGWHIPTATVYTGDYRILFQSYNNSPSNIIKTLRVPFAGYHIGSSIYDMSALYLSSSTSREYNSRSMDGAKIASATLYSSSYADRNYGYPVRCILQLPKLQEVTSSTLESSVPNNGDTTKLADSRDGDEYVVGKLADGNYWLLENLRLGGNSAITLTPNDTNIQSNWTLPASVSSTSNFVDSSTTGVIYAGNKISTYNSSYFDNTARRGVYYNYCATSGGTICYELPSDYQKRSPYDAAYDICPKGWRLPTKMEYESLFASYNDRQDIVNALKAPASGMIYNKSWSASYFQNSTSSLDSYYHVPITATIGQSNYSFETSWGTFTSGFPIRCIFGLGKTMQNITNAELAELLPNAGDVVTLRDSRDGDVYRIGKMADGRYWMLDNLRIGGSSSIYLTPEDTNITSSWTLPASVNSGFTNDDSGRTVARINTSSKNTLYKYGYQTYDEAGVGKIGTYYNYCAASAGTVCAVSNTINASVDVCPKGWRMPTGGPGGEYESLYASYSNNNYSLIPAFKLIRAGGYYDSAVTNLETTGFYLTSTRYDNDTMYRLWVGESNQAEPANIYGHRRPGYSIRCIRK